MLLFVHNETRPFFYQGFQRLGHKEIEKAYQIISIMNRNQIFSQTGETELIDIFILPFVQDWLSVSPLDILPLIQQ